MPSKKKTKKNTHLKKIPSVKERYESKIRQGKIGPLHQYRISLLKNYCQDKMATREELSKRRNMLSKKINVKITKLKEMYTYGTGTPEDWDILTEFLSETDQDLVKSFYIGHKFSKKKFELLPPDIQRIVVNLYKLTPLGRKYLDRLLETAVEIDKSS